MSYPIDLFVGFDPREAVVAHTFVQSVLSRTSADVAVHYMTPAHTTKYGIERRDGSNSFNYLRFLVPYLMSYRGTAIWADGDMLCLDDIANLQALSNPSQNAVQVVKHDYQTKHPVKYFGARNEMYERKNWSSVIIWHCGHYANRRLTPEYVAKQTGEHLHRFKWLEDFQIGEIPKEWNWLVSEYDHNPDAKLAHFTIGAPCFEEYSACDYSDQWKADHWNSQKPLIEAQR